MFAKYTKHFLLSVAVVIFASSIISITPAQAKAGSVERPVDANEGFTCALRQNDTVYCVGKNDKGQLGFSRLGSFSDPTAVPGLTPAQSVTTGKSFACSIGIDSYGYCWGDDEFGQLGTQVNGSQAKRIDLSKSLLDIQAGKEYVCALSVDLTVYCWGSLGVSGLEANNSSTPKLIAGLTGVSSIAVGDQDVCYITTALYCWGTTVNSLNPVKISNSDGAVAASVGANFICYLKSELVYCLGDNSNGQLGIGNKSTTVTVEPVTGLSGATAIYTGGQSACALTKSGASFCWGDNEYKQVSITSGDQPNRVPSTFSNAVNIAIASTHICALLKDSSIKCVGDNSSFQSGFLVSTEKPLPSSTGGPMRAVSSGTKQTCAITSDYKLRCWGDFVPVLDNEKQFTEVAVGPTSACAIGFDGKIWCWGSNSSGQLGDNSNRSSATPVEVQGLASSAEKIRAGSKHFCAISIDELVYCWGDNLKGQLGFTGDDAKTATLVPGISTAQDISLGDYHGCALSEAGRVYCWGDNSKKQILNTSSAKLPVTEFDISESIEIAAGGFNTCYILKTENRLTCIGDNTELQAPGQLAGSFTNVSVGGSSVCASRLSDKKVVCFGSNVSTKLGRTGLKSAVPTEVPDLSAGQVSVGLQHVCFIASQVGSMYCWGSNSDGQLASSYGFPGAFEKPTISISGKVNVGEKLTATVRSVNANVFTYQWYRFLSPSYQNAIKVPNATAQSFDLVANEISRTIAVGITLQKWGVVSEEFISTQTTQVGSQLKLLLSPTPTISGKFKVGSRLSVRAGRWETGVNLSYQWFRGTTAIAGAKSPTYQLTDKDVAKQISVSVTGLKQGLPKVTVRSTKSIKVVR